MRHPPTVVFPRIRHPWPDILAVMLVTVWLWPVLLGQEVPYARDVLTFCAPLGAEAGRAWREGRWPWWSGALGGGLPLWHHPSAEISSPLGPLYALLPPLHAFGVTLTVSCWLALLGASALARRLGASPSFAAWAGLGFVGCGPVASTWTVGQFRHAVLPWVGVAAFQVVRRRRGAEIALAVACALAFTLPDPPLLLSRVLLSALVVVIVARRADVVPALQRTGLAWCLGALLAAPVLLPAVSVIVDSGRTFVDRHPVAALSWAALLDSVAPGSAGLGGAAGLGAGLAPVRDDETVNLAANLFIGWLSVMFALTADRRLRRSRRFLLPVVAALVLLVLSRGAAVPGTGWLWQASGARFPDKLTEPAALLWLLAASRAGTRALALRRPLRAGVVVPAVGAIMFAASTRLADVAVAGMQGSLRADARDLFILVFSLEGALMVAAGALHARTRTLRPDLRGLLLVCVGAAELTLSFKAVVLTTPVERLARAAEEINAPMVPGQRVFAGRGGDVNLLAFVLDPTRTENDSNARLQVALPVPHAGVLGGAREVAAYDVSRLEPAPVTVFMSQVMPLLDNGAAATVLRRLGAERLVLGDDGTPVSGDVAAPRMVLDLRRAGRWRDLRVQDPVPRVTVEHRVETVPDARAAALRLADSRGPAAVVHDVTLPPLDPAARLEVTRVTEGTLEVRVTATQHTLLVDREAYAAGFHADVDGARVPLLHANIFQRAVLVPPGDHRVSMTYTPPRFGLGLLLAAVGALLLAFSAARRWPRARPPASPGVLRAP
ncbi:MAG: YfhO family protein [Deltaproteobacteria bacterium]|nr:YfhO family protein [Deltaproteobacteria bacterium]